MRVALLSAPFVAITLILFVARFPARIVVSPVTRLPTLGNMRKCVQAMKGSMNNRATHSRIPSGVLDCTRRVPCRDGLRAQQTTKTRNVILVTIDGMRWQEIFNGADPALIESRDGGVRAPTTLKKEFVRRHA